jgi:hypothetical protein
MPEANIIILRVSLSLFRHFAQDGAHKSNAIEAYRKDIIDGPGSYRRECVVKGEVNVLRRLDTQAMGLTGRIRDILSDLLEADVSDCIHSFMASFPEAIFESGLRVTLRSACSPLRSSCDRGMVRLDAVCGAGLSQSRL